MYIIYIYIYTYIYIIYSSHYKPVFVWRHDVRSFVIQARYLTILSQGITILPRCPRCFVPSCFVKTPWSPSLEWTATARVLVAGQSTGDISSTLISSPVAKQLSSQINSESPIVGRCWSWISDVWPALPSSLAWLRLLLPRSPAAQNAQISRPMQGTWLFHTEINQRTTCQQVFQAQRRRDSYQDS